MAVHVYTSFTYSYADRAQILSDSLKRVHPDWILWGFVVDKPPHDFDSTACFASFDKIVEIQQVLGEDSESWIFSHDIVEACTSIKGLALLHVFEDPTADYVIYLDPDIAIFNSLLPVIEDLQFSNIVLTPHQIMPEPRLAKMAIMDNELASLKHGVFNLGFIAVRRSPEGLRFANWWADRLADWCFDDTRRGIFTDQKWCDLIPCFFEGVMVSRDPGRNVASWNLSQRKISFNKDGDLLVNNVSLRFFHFTKLGQIGEMMTAKYAGGNYEVFELWRWYIEKIQRIRQPDSIGKFWFYGCFDNGLAIPKAVRVAYRENKILQNRYRNPRKTGAGTLLDFLTHKHPSLLSNSAKN